MNLASKQLYIILVILVVLLVVGLISVYILYSNCRYQLSEQSQQPTGQAGYPDNLLEGIVVSVNLEEPRSLVIEADVSKLFPNAGVMERNIMIDSETELVFHNITPEYDSQISLSELKSGDFVVVAVKEPVRQRVLEEKTFTALRVTKIVSSQ